MKAMDEMDEVDESVLMAFQDPKAIRKSILDRTKSAFETKFPLDDGNVRIELTNLAYDEKKSHYGPSAMKKAVMTGGRLSVPLRGDFKMVDAVTGDVLDQRKNHLVANVPYLTDRGTFVNNGTEYVVSSQTRLRAGVYSRRKENGELEAHVNPKPGTGASMRVFMEPETGVFRAMIGDSRIKLYPVLKAVGVSDDDLRARWGDKVWEANKKGGDDKAFDRFFDKIVGKRAERFRERLEAAAMADDDSIPDGEPEDDEESGDVPRKMAAAMVVSGSKSDFTVNRRALADARRAVDRSPGEAKAKSGNYRKGHVRINGLDITIENPKGSTRSGTGPDGKTWTSRMAYDYGYFRGSEGSDGDHVDVFLGPHLESEAVFVVDQIDQKKKTFDEHKVVLGCLNREEAKEVYLANYEKGWVCGNIVPMTMDGLKWWLRRGDTTKPAAEAARKFAERSKAVDLLVGAKAESDRGNYKAKEGILAALMRESPAEFFIDSEDGDIVGITHAPSNFRIHVKRRAVPDGVGARRKEAARPERRERPELPPLPGGRGQAMAAEKAGIVLEQLSRMELDPEISSRNLGRDHANFGPDAIVDTTSKLLAINRGEIDVDDRDDKANQTVHTVDDFMEERVQKDAGQIARTLLYRSRYNGSLKALKPGHFTPQLESLIVGNSLSQVAGGVNPLDLWDARFRITQVGEGGIGSADSIPVDARNVHPSQLGMIDVIRTPESGSVGIDQRIVSSARKGPNHQLFMPLVDKRTGKRVWRTPSQIYGKRVLFPRFKT